MAKGTYTLICPGCKTVHESIFKAAPCVGGCGQIMERSPLDSSFEDAAQGDEIVVSKKPSAKKPASTKGRSAEDGGESF